MGLEIPGYTPIIPNLVYKMHTSVRHLVGEAVEPGAELMFLKYFQYPNPKQVFNFIHQLKIENYGFTPAEELLRKLNQSAKEELDDLTVENIVELYDEDAPFDQEHFLIRRTFLPLKHYSRLIARKKPGTSSLYHSPESFWNMANDKGVNRFLIDICVNDQNSLDWVYDTMNSGYTLKNDCQIAGEISEEEFQLLFSGLRKCNLPLRQLAQKADTTTDYLHACAQVIFSNLYNKHNLGVDDPEQMRIITPEAKHVM
jgi:hypothetical protein